MPPTFSTDAPLQYSEYRPRNRGPGSRVPDDAFTAFLNCYRNPTEDNRKRLDVVMRDREIYWLLMKQTQAEQAAIHERGLSERQAARLTSYTTKVGGADRLKPAPVGDLRKKA